jgi:phage tail sheath protein FI
VEIRPAAYDPDGLLTVQRALLTFCQARSDVVAVLDLPPHFGTREALDWRQQLADTPAFADGDPLSYAAVYHPWLQAPEPVTPDLAPLRSVPPSGALCGTIGARELARGCWIAPANVPLRGVVALAPSLPAPDWPALFDARFNLVRRQPGQFSALSAHTLSDDRQFVQLSVRRLLIFLRKLALLRGMRYVFETNTQRFRQRVQHAFERTLRQLAARGAVVAFRVVADDSLNTPYEVDNGRLVVAIQVAPTQPVEFITVVLIRSTEDVLSVVET